MTSAAAAPARGRLLASADLAPAAWTLSGRGLEAEVDPLWVGVREYRDEADPTRVVREFRDPEQVRDPAYLRLWERLAAAPGHPVHDAGDGRARLVFLDATAPPEGAPHPADPDGAVLFPHAAYQCGTTGDSHRMVPGEHGTEVPRFKLTVTDAATIERIMNPAGGYRRDQVSPGFLRYVVDQPGVWVAPDGSTHPYDREQVVNPADPRVPEKLRPWVGPNYLGVGFDGRQGWTRGRGVARITLDGIVASRDDGPGDMSEQTGPEGQVPRLFTLTRVADESGVSGTGLVLRGVVWPAGQVTVCWCAPSGPVPVAENLPQSYLSWKHFAAIHVGQHPAEQSVIEFLDGEPPPAPSPAPDAPPPPDPEAPMQPNPASPTAPNPAPQQPVPTPDAPPPADPVAALKAENEMLKKQVEDLKNALAAAQQAKTSADGEVSRLRGERDALVTEVKPHREQARKAEVERVAAVAGVDGDTLAAQEDEVEVDGAKTKVPARDLRVAAMRLRLTADGGVTPEDLADPAYLRARYDLLAKAGNPAPAARAAADGPSPAFREPLAASARRAPTAPAARDTSFDLP